MRRLLAFCACVALAAPSRAAQGFFAPGDLPRKPAGLDAAFAAVIRLERANLSDTCSAVAVSADGYLLTNIHCVEGCLEQAGWLEDGGAAVAAGEGYRVLSVARQPPEEGLACPGYMWSTPSLYTGGARLVWLGRGKETFDEGKVDAMSGDAVSGLAENQDDAALLKFDVPSAVPCLRAALAAPGAGEPVWAIGYPLWTTRHDGHDSDGAGKYVSYGLVRGSLRDDPYLPSLIETPSAWARLESIYGKPQLLLSDLDIMPGNSGGAMIDADGRLAALSYGIVKNTQERYLGATALGLRLTTIRAEIEAALGKEKAAAVFSCPR